MAKGRLPIKFDQQMIDRLPLRRADEKDWIQTDKATTGLCIRGRQTANVFYFCYKFHGAKRWMPIGDCKAVSLQDARKIAVRARARVLDGGDPAAERLAAKAGAAAVVAAEKVAAAKTLDAMLDDYEAIGFRDFSPASIKQYKGAFRRTIRKQLGAKLAAEITLTDCELLHQSLRTKPVMANRTIAILSAALTWGQDHDWIPKDTNNPCHKVKRYPTTPRTSFRNPDTANAACRARGHDDRRRTSRRTDRAGAGAYSQPMDTTPPIDGKHPCRLHDSTRFRYGRQPLTTPPSCPPAARQGHDGVIRCAAALTRPRTVRRLGGGVQHPTSPP